MESKKLKFEGIYCLSLKDDEFKRQEFLRQFNNIDIPIEVQYGIDGRIIEKFQLPVLNKAFARESNAYIKEFGFFSNSLTNSEIACAKGHMQIWEKISKAPTGSVFLVCEDDARIKGDIDFIKTIDKVITQMNVDYFVYCGYLNWKNKQKMFRVFLNIKNIVKYVYRRYIKLDFFACAKLISNLDRLNLFNQSFFKSGMNWGAFAYLCTPEVATKLISLNQNFDFTSDGTFRYGMLRKELKCYNVYPGIFNVDFNLKSSIRSNEDQENVKENYNFG
jgi:GR25 family glycosyltransferase involved in LPS biosynthesis